MRIKCSKCGAEGNIDDAKIPETGAYVRCPRCSERFLVDKNRVENSSPSPLVMQSGPEPASPAAMPAAAPEPGPASFESTCSVCGKTFPQFDMIRFGETWVCARCKPGYIQMLQQGTLTPGEMSYGGFWIRLGAKLLDGLALLVLNFIFSIPLSFAQIPGPMPVVEPGKLAARMLIQLIVPFVYTTFFLGKYGATLGKMACGLKVVRADGGKISYSRAFGRYFAEILSSIILCIGYIMAAFDDEKRTLHDRICDTRVIRK